MPRLLVGIMSCHRMEYRNPHNPDVRDWFEKTRYTDPAARRQACRETWLQGFVAAGVDYKFFLGLPTIEKQGKRLTFISDPCPPPVADDEVQLECGDGYYDNGSKMQAIVRWALANGYDYLLRTDDDMYVYADRILKTEWKDHPYSGAWNGSMVSFHPGGCMFLSRQAMEIVARSPVTHWADDAWIGKLLRDHQIPAHLIPSIHIPFGDEYFCDPTKLALDHEWSAIHCCYPPVMRELKRRSDAENQVPHVV